MKTFNSIVSLAAAAILAGCSNLPRYNAEEITHIISGPGFSTDLNATGIAKETLEDGTVIRRAETLTNTVKILGFSRTAVYKNAELETVAED